MWGWDRRVREGKEGGKREEDGGGTKEEREGRDRV